MAVTANYNNASAQIGIYGLYNPFTVMITRTGAAVFKLSYTVKLTTVQDGKEYTRPVTPQSGTTAIVDPLELVRGNYFKGEYTGFTENTAHFAYSDVKIEIGETYAATADVPPVFQGFTTSDTFYFYNGFENGRLVDNFREPNWYNTTPYKLPKVKKLLRLIEDDIEILSMPSYLNAIAGSSPNLSKLIFEYYDDLDILLSTVPINLTTRPDLVGLGYWNMNINSIFPVSTRYCIVYCQWDDGEALFNSEEIRIATAECNVKNDRYRLRWLNRYGADELETFDQKSTKQKNVKKGKEVLSDGINYAAATFADIKNINNPNLRRVGTSYTRSLTISTNYLDQEALNALDELYNDRGVLLFDKDNNALPVMIQDSSYQIVDVRNELKKVSVTVMVADLQPIQLT